MIFQFTYPNYDTDYDDDRENPVTLDNDFRIPSINCEECAIWAASTARIWCATTGSQRQAFAKIQILPRLQWQQEAPAWAELLDVPLGAIAPGAAIGIPAACQHHDIPNDFLHTGLGPTLATESARAFIQSHKLTGVEFHPLEVHCGATSPNATAPSLYAMEITANAWRIGVTPESMRVCDLCGRTKLPQDIAMRMDPSRSDNTDFFTVDENPGQTYVSDRAAKLLEDSGLTNFRLRPIPISR